MTWTVILDPHAVAGGIPALRTELDLNSGPIRVDQKGIDWGDSQIQTYMADRRVGSIKVDFRIPNRKVTIPLFLLDDESGTTEEEARASLQEKVGLIQMRGGWLMRQRNGGPPTYADIIDAVLTLPDIWGETGGVEPNINLILECSPDFYGDEISLDAMAVSAREVATTLQHAGATAAIAGDHLGRAQILITDTSGNDQLSLIWAFRSRYYDSAPSAALIHSAANLQLIAPATVTTVAGISGVRMALSTSWLAIVQTNIAGSQPMTHVGSYRIRARVYTTSSSNVWLRLIWGVGASVGTITNALVLIPGAPSNFYLVDLGEIRIDYPPAGSVRWEGQIQGMGQFGGEDVFIDKVYLQPLDDVAGLAIRNPSVSSLSSPEAADPFDETAGNLAGKVAPTGNTWSEAGASTTPHFLVSGSGTATRTGADTNPHFALLGPSLDFTDVAVDVSFDNVVEGNRQGVVGRYADNSNWVGMGLTIDHLALSQIHLVKCIAGTTSALVTYTFGYAIFAPSTFYNLRLTINPSGAMQVYYRGSLLFSFTDAAIPPIGRAGLWEESEVTGNVRSYNNFVLNARTSTTDAVVFSNASAALRYDGMYRTDPGNGFYGPISTVVGDLPRIPPSGVEQKPVELFLLLSQGDLGVGTTALADTGLGSFTAEVSYRPVRIHRA